MKVEAMDYDEQSNLLTARRIALAEGRTVRARNMKSVSANSTNHGATRRPTMVVPETPSSAGLGQIPSETSVSASYMDLLLYAPQAHDELAHVMSLPSPGSSAYTDAFRSSAQMPPPPAQLDLTRALAPGGPGMLGTFACRTPPALDHEVTQLAWCSVSTDEASFNCWACRTPGHSIFTCPSIPAPSRTFFAYRYWLHANPRATREDVARAISSARRRFPQADFSKSPPAADVPREIPPVTFFQPMFNPHRAERTHRGGRGGVRVRFGSRSTVHALSETRVGNEATYPISSAAQVDRLPDPEEGHASSTTSSSDSDPGKV